MPRLKPILFCLLLLAGLPAHAQYTDTYTMPDGKMWGVFLDRQCFNYGENGCLTWSVIPDCIPLRGYPNRCRMVVDAPPGLSGQSPSNRQENSPRQSPPSSTQSTQDSPIGEGVLIIILIIGVLVLRGVFAPSRRSKWDDHAWDDYGAEYPRWIDPMPHIPRIPGLHRHHIIPRHMGGTDDPDNIAYLTPAEHAQAHLDLYREYGKEEDLWAYRQLSQNSFQGDSQGEA